MDIEDIKAIAREHARTVLDDAEKYGNDPRHKPGPIQYAWVEGSVLGREMTAKEAEIFEKAFAEAVEQG